MIPKTLLIMGLLRWFGFGGCNTANKGKMKDADNPITECCGIS